MASTRSDRLVPVAEAAAEKGCSARTIRRALKRGRLNGERLGRFYFIARDEKLAAFEVHETGKRTHTGYRQLKPKQSKSHNFMEGSGSSRVGTKPEGGR